MSKFNIGDTLEVIDEKHERFGQYGTIRGTDIVHDEKGDALYAYDLMFDSGALAWMTERQVTFRKASPANDRPVKLSLMDYNMNTQTPDEIVEDLFKSIEHYNDRLKGELDQGERRSIFDAKSVLYELLKVNAPGGFQMLKKRIAFLQAERDALHAFYRFMLDNHYQLHSSKHEELRKIVENIVSAKLHLNTVIDPKDQEQQP